jgi:hypothetical protein
MANNPYSAYSRRGDEVDERQALIDALDEPQAPITPRTRTPTRPPEQTREMLSGPGGRTSYMDPNEAADVGRDIVNAGQTADVGGNAFSGDRFADERQEPVYQPPSTTTTQPNTGAHVYNPQVGSTLLDAYDDPYQRRNEGSGGVLSNAARWGQTGATVGSVVPGVGTLVGGVVGGIAGAIGGAFTKNAKTAMTDFAIDDARAIISQAHKDAFGRDIDPAYLDQIVRGQGWEPGDRWMGEGSLRYVLDAFAQQAPGERAGQAANAAATPAASATPAGATAGGTGGGLSFSGFDFNRAQDPSKSAKDAFAAAAQQAPPMTDTSKAGADAWFREHIAPQMEASGYKIYDLQGDKAWVGSREDPEGQVPVDWLINAGGSNPQIGWQPDSGGGGGEAAGDAPGDLQGAYSYLKSIAHPGMSRPEMESAIAKAFGNVPGFEKAYAGDVVINGKKIDLITNFEGPGASWSDNLSFVPLHGGGSPAGVAGSGGGLVGGSGLSLAPNVQLAAPLQRSDANAQIMAELQRLLSGQPPRDELLEALG